MSKLEYKLDALGYKGLAYLIEGIEQYYNDMLSTNKFSPNTNIIKGLEQLSAYLVLQGETMDNSLYDYNQLVKMPLKEIKHPFIQKCIEEHGISEDLKLYNPEEFNPIDGCNTVKLFLNADEDVDTYYNNIGPFLDILSSLDEKSYNIARHGIVHTTIASDKEFSKIYDGIDTKVISRIKEKFYKTPKEHQVFGEDVYICPSCGYLMEINERGSLYCPIEKCESIKIKSNQSLNDFIKMPRPLYVLNKEAQTYIKIPVKQEDIFYEEIIKIKENSDVIESVERFPEKDKSDFRIKLKDGSVIIVDVKDFINPYRLANYFDKHKSSDIANKDWNMNYDEAYVVVGDYLGYKNYKSKFEKNYDGSLKLLSISEFVKKLTNNQ